MNNGEINLLFEIWVMREYAIQSSWTMSIVVLIDEIPNFYYFSPICFAKDGEVVGIDMNKMDLQLMFYHA